MSAILNTAFSRFYNPSEDPVIGEVVVQGNSSFQRSTEVLALKYTSYVTPLATRMT
jgi:hypothetical protein